MLPLSIPRRKQFLGWTLYSACLGCSSIFWEIFTAVCIRCFLLLSSLFPSPNVFMVVCTLISVYDVCMLLCVCLSNAQVHFQLEFRHIYVLCTNPLVLVCFVPNRMRIYFDFDLYVYDFEYHKWWIFPATYLIWSLIEYTPVRFYGISYVFPWHIFRYKWESIEIRSRSIAALMANTLTHIYRHRHPHMHPTWFVPYTISFEWTKK